MKTIQFEIPDSVYESLVDTAQRRGTTVTKVLQGAAVALSREWNRPVAKRIGDLHSARLSVADIAAEMGMTNAAVKRHLAALQLTPHPKTRATPPENPRARKA